MGAPNEGSGEVPIELASGTMVGEYEVGKLLGKGGFGSVYAAVHPVIGKQVAIKVLTLRYSVDRAMVSRFIAEARAVNQIRHQHIIDIFSHGKLPDGRQYYVMELLDGTTLDRYIKDRTRLTIPEAVQILRPVALALDAAHAAGIAHRDLKPENVFVARDAMGEPFPKLLDFGLAKLMGPEMSGVDHSTQSGLMMGTPSYMSPEQCRGRDVDHRTDLYALGVMTYQMLTGRLPFTGLDHMDVIFKQMNDQPRAPSLSGADLTPDGDEAVLALLAKDADDRPDSALAAINALAIAGGMAPLATPSTKPFKKATATKVADANATVDLNRGKVVAATLAADAATVAPASLMTGETASMPPKSMSLPMGEVTPATTPQRRRTWLYGGVALVLVGGGLAAWRLSTSAAGPTAADLVKQADDEVALGHFKAAAVAYKHASEIEQDPTKRADDVYKVASAFHRAGDCKNTSFFFKRFLAVKEQDPADPLTDATRAQVTADIAAAEACLHPAAAAPPDAGIDAPPADAAVELITVHFDGAPPGTRVVDDKGRELVTLPGDFQVPRGAAIAVRLEHVGYEPLPFTIRPDAPLPPVKVTLKPRVVAPVDRVGDFGK